MARDGGSPLPGTPLVWAPAGVSDTLDASTSPPGAMASLQNLIPDPSTAQLWQCRPAAVIKTTFPGLIAGGFSPGFSPGFAVAGVQREYHPHLQSKRAGCQRANSGVLARSRPPDMARPAHVPGFGDPAVHGHLHPGGAEHPRLPVAV